jgi:hypothetical protein
MIALYKCFALSQDSEYKIGKQLLGPSYGQLKYVRTSSHRQLTSLLPAQIYTNIKNPAEKYVL